MVWWNTKPVEAAVKENRDRFFKRQGINPARVVSGGLIHGIHTAVVEEKDAGEYLVNTDSLITKTQNIFLAITVADCPPVFFFDPVTLSVGIAHAGWRGMVGGILENVVHQLERSFGAQATDLHAIIGPHIQACHFEVGSDVAAQFGKDHIEQRDGCLFVNIGAEAKQRLQKVGVRNVLIDQTCTFDAAEHLFSARHDKVQPLQGMVAFIGMGDWQKINL